MLSTKAKYTYFYLCMYVVIDDSTQMKIYEAAAWERIYTFILWWGEN